MSKNSIEEDIAITKKMITTKFNNDYSIDNKDKEAIEHILTDYKKILKENETLKCSIAVANKLEELIKEDFIPKGKIVDIIEKEEYIKVSIKDIFDVKIHNFNYLSETDWSEAQRIIDKEVANILQQILQELLESEETNDKNNKKG